MRMRMELTRNVLRALAGSLLVLALVATPTWAQGQGRIEGRVVGPNGNGIGGVAVVVQGLGLATVTDSRGEFSFENVAAGTYDLSLTLGDQSRSEEGVDVAAGRTTDLQVPVDWTVSFLDTITVYSASRQVERITDAPAAITVIPEEQIQRESTHGQLPKLLEFTPGAEVTQSGLYDFNFNTRGFNSSLNRRILVLVDGRDPSVPFLGSQEWGALSFPLDDVSTIEFVRGPGSALYGADAFNGVLNVITKPPRTSQGGQLQLSGGELSTAAADLRWATDLGNDWYMKLTGGYEESEDFSQSRNLASGGPEYPGLDPEPIPLALEENEIVYGSLRFDKHFDNGRILSFEGAQATVEGPVAQTGIGRVQLVDVERPWARVNFNTVHWNFLANWNRRDAADQVSLRSGQQLVLDTENFNVEIQGNAGFGDGRGRIIGGAYYKEEDIDSANAAGFQTLMFEPQQDDFQGVFGQLDWEFSDKLKAVVAARFDDSSLHDSQVSPRASLVYSLHPDHTLRFSYSEAFQVPNYSEFFLRAAVAPPITALAPVEGICQLGGVACGFDQPVSILAAGNPTLEVEEVQSAEIGYSGLLNRRAYLTLDLYRNDYDNFITDLITRVQAGIGNINPLFPAYQPPAGLPAPLRALLLGTLQGALGPQFALLSNDPITGAPVLVPVSYVNFGAAEAQGAELGLNYYITDDWVFDLSYAYFDFDVDQQLAEDPVLPNTAENKYSLGISYIGNRFDASFKIRGVDGFQWNAGVFRGAVPSYEVAQVSANYRVTDDWGIGIDVSNVFDDEHFESFGGDILERRALARITYSW